MNLARCSTSNAVMGSPLTTTTATTFWPKTAAGAATRSRAAAVSLQQLRPNLKACMAIILSGSWGSSVRCQSLACGAQPGLRPSRHKDGCAVICSIFVQCSQALAERCRSGVELRSSKCLQAKLHHDCLVEGLVRIIRVFCDVIRGQD